MLARWVVRWGVAGALRSDLRITAGDVGAEAGIAAYEKECFAIAMKEVVESREGMVLGPSSLRAKSESDAPMAKYSNA